jgi:hypothetical protein
MGVFRVRNTVTGKSLLGVSTDLPSMLNRQRFQLGSGGHPDHELQRDYQELGTDAFEVTVVDELERSGDPGTDPANDLQAPLEMWRDKLAEAGEDDFYGGPRSGR